VVPSEEKLTPAGSVTSTPWKVMVVWAMFARAAAQYRAVERVGVRSA